MLFELVIRGHYHFKWLVSITGYISRISLAIFFVHILILRQIYPLLKPFDLARPLQVGILWIVTILLSIMITWLLSHITLIRKHLY